jgi:hypothetical protein
MEKEAASVLRRAANAGTESAARRLAGKLNQVHRSANAAPPVPTEERSSEHVDDGGSGSQQIDHRLKPREMANLETGLILTSVGRRWHGLDS